LGRRVHACDCVRRFGRLSLLAEPPPKPNRSSTSCNAPAGEARLPRRCETPISTLMTCDSHSEDVASFAALEQGWVSCSDSDGAVPVVYRGRRLCKAPTQADLGLHLTVMRSGDLSMGSGCSRNLVSSSLPRTGTSILIHGCGCACQARRSGDRAPRSIDLPSHGTPTRALDRAYACALRVAGAVCRLLLRWPANYKLPIRSPATRNCFSRDQAR